MRALKREGFISISSAYFICLQQLVEVEEVIASLGYWRFLEKVLLSILFCSYAFGENNSQANVPLERQLSSRIQHDIAFGSLSVVLKFLIRRQNTVLRFEK